MPSGSPAEMTWFKRYLDCHQRLHRNSLVASFGLVAGLVAALSAQATSSNGAVEPEDHTEHQGQGDRLCREWH